MPEQLSKFNDIGVEELGNIEPSNVGIPSPLELTEQENAELTKLLNSARDAEKAGDIHGAMSIYGQYRAEYQKLRFKESDEIIETLNLQEQYQKQVEILQSLGLLQENNGSYGMDAVDDNFYPIPSFEMIREKLSSEKIKTLEKKVNQGFLKLLIVPFGMSLGMLQSKYNNFLRDKSNDHTLFSVSGKRYGHRMMEGSYGEKDVNEEGGLKYRQGQTNKTKKQLVASGNAWQVLLVEDLDVLATEATAGTIGGRVQIHSGEPPNQYLRDLQEDQYSNEKGFTPEIWFMNCITKLYEDNIQLDAIEDSSGCNLIGAVYEADNKLRNEDLTPTAGWLSSQELIVSHHQRPDQADERFGVRTAVEI